MPHLSPRSAAAMGGRRSKQLFCRRRNTQSGEVAQGLHEEKSEQSIGRIFYGENLVHPMAEIKLLIRD
jgi:hypothetical protein